MDYDQMSDGGACYDDQDEDCLMIWTEPQYSKSAIDKAGKNLIASPSQEEYVKALTVLNNWRALHALPLNSIQASLRYRAKDISKDALISQRLKRVPSIKIKLTRSKGMRLIQMQDIGGCRAILPTVEEVYSLRDRMVFKQRLRSNLVKEDDYINTPKISGYRGIHLIYRFKGKKDSIHNGLLIEVQIRSAIQHAWATSVEIAGAFLGVPLKSGEGRTEWLEFFRLVSILFAKLEGYVSDNFNKELIWETKQKVIDLRDRLSIIENLKAFSVVTEEIHYIDVSDGYFLMILHVDVMTIEIRHYQKDELKVAVENYLRLEEENKNNNTNIVLVAAESLISLRKAYPNYFADSQMFINTLEKALEQ